jgi:hypothetical protein
MGYEDVDEHIDRLRNGGTLTENEVKNLCDKVSYAATYISQENMVGLFFY